MGHIPTILRARHARSALALGACLVLASSLACAGNPTIAGVQVHSGESEAVRAWVQAVEAGDAQAIARMHDANSVLYGTDAMVTQGGQAITAGYAGMFAQFDVDVEIKDAGWVRAGKFLNSWGLFTLTLTPKQGQGAPVRVEGRFSDLTTKVDGRWQYIVDHASLPSR